MEEVNGPPPAAYQIQHTFRRKVVDKKGVGVYVWVCVADRCDRIGGQCRSFKAGSGTLVVAEFRCSILRLSADVCSMVDVNEVNGTVVESPLNTFAITCAGGTTIGI